LSPSSQSVLALLCRISISPDSCVRKNELSFARRGVATLVMARFVPGLDTLAPPLADALGLSAQSFAIFNAAGAALWAGAGIAGGLIFHEQIRHLLESLSDLGRMAVWVVLVRAEGAGLPLRRPCWSSGTSACAF
jgi:membrane protein DedA with SNARE-associated domain